MRGAAWALAATVILGVALRWALAGAAWPEGWSTWANARSAHSHLGMYGVVVPLAWVAWRRVGVEGPSRLEATLYAVAVVASAIGFVIEGYGPVSIVGSTVVLGVWLHTAWRLRAWVVRAEWSALAAPAIVGAAMTIPLVARATARGDPAGSELVRAFMTWLCFGVGVGAALVRSKARPPPRGLALLVLGCGLAVGPVPGPVLRLCLLGFGLVVAWAVVPVVHDAVRWVWVAWSAGLVAVGVGALPLDDVTAISGLHVTLLGPIVQGLLPTRRLWLERAHTFGVLGFGAALLGPHLGWPGWATGAAWVGSGVAVLVGVRAVDAVFGRST